MALKSAELAGIPMPEPTRQGIIRYLQSVASGQSAAWPPIGRGEPPTRTMTAEALLCWQFLGMSRDHPACDEAANYLLGALPGRGPPNFYYWYYGTLAMYQFQGERWQRWNTAVQPSWWPRSTRKGPLAGSWDPDSVWGGYGGRIYSTALGALCLEVYYRFLRRFIRTSGTSEGQRAFPLPPSALRLFFPPSPFLWRGTLTGQVARVQ